MVLCQCASTDSSLLSKQLDIVVGSQSGAQGLVSNSKPRQKDAS